MKRGAWSTRLGFYMVAIGSAFGLGNLWRFPYVVGTHGGGAFIVLYVFFAITIGLSLLIAELMLGKITRQGILGAVREVTGQRPWRIVGFLSIAAALIALSYYTVICGWVLHFVSRYFVSAVSSSEFSSASALKVLMDSGGLQVALASAHILITVVIVARGVQEGIEKWVGYMMPLFIILMVVLLVQSLSLPSAGEAIRFLFYPDFSKLKASSFVQALGHVMFTMSLGFGTMVVFGSYMHRETHLPSAGFKVTVIDTSISVLAGLLIFPIVFSDPTMVKVGPELLFESIPLLIQGLGWGPLWGTVFFLCLYLAGLGASIGLLEGCVSNLIDRMKIKRSYSVWLIGIVVFIFALFPALSSSTFKDFSFRGMGLLAILDAILITAILPIIALGISLVVGYKLNRSQREREFIDPNRQASVRLFPNWLFMLRWFAPAVIAGALLIEVMSFF